MNILKKAVHKIPFFKPIRNVRFIRKRTTGMQAWLRGHSRKLTVGETMQYLLIGILMFLPILLNTLFKANEDVGYSGIAVYLCFSTIFIAIMICFRIPKYWVSLPLLFTIVYSAYILTVGQDVGYHVISSIYATNRDEAKEFLGSSVLLQSVIACLMCLVLGWFIIFKKWKRSFFVKQVSLFRRRWFATAIGACCVLLFSWNLCGYELKNVYPFRFIGRNIQYINEVRTICRAYKNLNYQYQGPQADQIEPESQTLIMIIGESARAQNWQLYGYSRPTTPHMKQWLKQYPEQTILFPKMVASGRVTRVVIPSLLSVSNAQEYARFYNYPSILRVFRQAGYKTYVVSCQPPTGYYEGLPNMILSDAEVVHYMKYLLKKQPIDEYMLPYIDKCLDDDSAKKKLIIVHMQGSHLEYDNRYPDKFSYFNSGNNTLDTYDNSIRYTDWILKEIFERARQRPESTAVMYTSDHGENLNDSGDGNFSHGVMDINVFEVHIPMIWYFNQSFTGQYPETVKYTHDRKNQLVNHDIIAHTLLGMAGLKDEQVYKPDCDMSSEYYQPSELYFADSMHYIRPISELPAFQKLIEKWQIELPQRKTEQLQK